MRAEYVHYDYDNRMLDGNTATMVRRADSVAACIRDRRIAVTILRTWRRNSASAGRSEMVSPFTQMPRAAFGHRQMTELYRLQSGQEVADLDSETLDSLELGVRLRNTSVSVDAALFAMQKRDSVLRDADGFNVSGGRTRHRGIETAIRWPMTDACR